MERDKERCKQRGKGGRWGVREMGRDGEIWKEVERNEEKQGW